MQNSKFRRCSIEDLYRVWSAPDGSQLLDVREYSEYAQEHIPGLTLAPLSGLEMHARILERERPVFVVCHWGNRSTQAAKKLVQWGFQDVRVVDGGMLAWTAAELPVERGGSSVWALDRQVRFTAGAVAMLGALLAWLAHPLFMVLPLVTGAGLMYAAVTNSCALGMCLARMPWNQQTASFDAPAPQEARQ